MLTLKKEKFLFVFLILLYVVIYSFYLPQDIMDIDSTQYAEITREMVENQDYFAIRDNGRKYLDKPIMTFWILSIFFKLFGASNFAFRLPALIMALLSVWGIYKISLLLYKEEKKAELSSLIYLSSPALFTMLTSPIIDIYLTTFIIFVFLFYYYGLFVNEKYFYLMYLFIGIGFITKGPISLVLPIITIGGKILLTKDWDLLKKLRIGVGIVIVGIPVGLWCYFLYSDFGIFGPYFFLYLQSFGRFFSKIYDTGWDPFYFYNTFLFSILHVSIPFVIVLFRRLKNLSLKNIDKKNLELYLWVFLVLILLSFSKFRLPQYIFWLIPGAAILAGDWFVSSLDKKVLYSFYIIPTIVLILLVLLPFYTGESFKFLFYLTLFFVLILLFLFYHKDSYAMLYVLFSFALFYSYVVSSLYPMLISYQPASRIAKIIFQIEENQPYSKKVLYTQGIPFSHRSYAFYTNRLTRPYILKKEQFIEELNQEKKKLIVVEGIFLEAFKEEIKSKFSDKITINVIAKFPYYKVSRPSWEFFNKNKRDKMFKYVYLLDLQLN
jgi:hypothetical protein